MKHLTMAESQQAYKNAPEGEIFAVHETKPKAKSMYVLTSVENEEWFCFGMKLKGQVFCSNWVAESEGKEAARDAMKQMLFIKKGGWYYTGETRYDDMNLHKEPLFRCVYCNNETVNVKGPCVCRRVASGS